MHCFYHQDKHAVGTCRSCGKGVCIECAVDLGKGLACRGRCEETVRAIIQLVDRNIQLSTNPTTAQLVIPPAVQRTNQPTDYVAAKLNAHIRETNYFQWILGGFSAIVGILLFVWGLSGNLVVVDIVGLCCIGFAITCITRARRNRTGPKAPETQTR